MIKVPDFIVSIINDINSLGFDAFLVGGWVRDALLDRESHDYDIASSCPLDKLTELFSDYNINDNAAHLGNIAFKHDGMNIEITRFRKEFDYKDRVPGRVEFIDSLYDDLVRRDFTINTIAYHPAKGIIDLLGGSKDLDKGILRSLGDPKVKFREDPLRVLRLIRFQSQLGFSIEEHTALAVYESSLELTIKQWSHEFFKLICGEHFLRVALDHALILGRLIPELSLSYDFDQLNPYHNYSLYEHSIRVSACLRDDLDMRLVGLFHDMGKLDVQVIDDLGVGHYRMHSQASCHRAQPYLEAFGLSKKRSKRILDLIALHDMSLKETHASIHSITSLYGYDFVKDLIALKRCDNSAKSPLAAYQVDRCDVFSGLLEDVKDWPMSIHDLLISSQELMDVGIDKKEIKEVLSLVLKEVISEEAGNDEIKQKEILRRVLNDYVY